MALKAKASKMAPTSQAKYPFPSLYGSHASMMVKDNEDGTVVCKDEFGEYVTPKNRLDCGLADPNRYAESRIAKLFQGKEKKKDER